MFSFYFWSPSLARKIFDLPDHGFLLQTWSTGPMEWSTGNSYQAEALTNVLRYHTCRSSHPEVAAWITKYLNKYVRRGLCLIYISSFYFWSPPLARKIRKNNVLYYPEYSSRFWGPEGGEHIGNTSYFNLPPDIGFTLFTPIKGRIYSLTVYIYKAETCTNIFPPLARKMRKTNVLYYPEYSSRSWHPILAP
jgi:hypothetical protein